MATKAEKRQQRKKEREQARAEREHAYTKVRQKKNFVWYGLGALILFVIAYFIYSAVTTEPFTEGAVHWHATLAFDVCGERQEPPIVPVEDHLLHTHDDKLIHVEGKVWDEGQIAMNAYMEVLHIPFAQGRFQELKDGDPCPEGTPLAGQTGVVWMTVDEVLVEEYTRHVIRDGQDIIIGFGPRT